MGNGTLGTLFLRDHCDPPLVGSARPAVTNQVPGQRRRNLDRNQTALHLSPFDLLGLGLPRFLIRVCMCKDGTPPKSLRLDATRQTRVCPCVCSGCDSLSAFACGRFQTYIKDEGNGCNSSEH